MLLPWRPWLQHCPVAWGLVQRGPDSEQRPCSTARLGQGYVPSVAMLQASRTPHWRDPWFEGSFF